MWEFDEFGKLVYNPNKEWGLLPRTPVPGATGTSSPKVTAGNISPTKSIDRFSRGWNSAFINANLKLGKAGKPQFADLQSYMDKKGGLFKMSKANNPFSKGNLKSGASSALLGTAAQLAGGFGYKGFSEGYDSGAGQAINKYGSMIGSTVGQFNPVAGAIITAGSGILGGLTNRFVGLKTNKAAQKTYNENLSRGLSYRGAASDFDSVREAPIMQSHANVYKGGHWSHRKANRKNADIAKVENYAGAYARGQMLNNIATLNHKQSNNMLANYSAFGGPMFSGVNGPSDYQFMNQYLANMSQRNEFNNKPSQMPNSFMNMGAFGGTLLTNGAAWPTGLIKVGKGGTHEENPKGGVTVGADDQGVSNMVEQNETIGQTKMSRGKQVKDYVFSDRLTVPLYSKEYKEGGQMPYEMKALKKYEGKTFAKASEMLEKDSGVNERPNDVMAQNMFAEGGDLLKQAQEKERQKEQLKELMEAIDQMTPEQLEQFQQQLAMLLQGQMQQPSQEEQMAMQQQMTPEDQAAMMQQQAVPQEVMPQQEAMAQQPASQDQTAMMQPTPEQEAIAQQYQGGFSGEPDVTMQGQPQYVEQQALGGNLYANGGDLIDESNYNKLNLGIGYNRFKELPILEAIRYLSNYEGDTDYTYLLKEDAIKKAQEDYSKLEQAQKDKYTDMRVLMTTNNAGNGAIRTWGQQMNNARKQDNMKPYDPFNSQNSQAENPVQAPPSKPTQSPIPEQTLSVENSQIKTLEDAVNVANVIANSQTAAQPITTTPPPSPSPTNNNTTTDNNKKEAPHVTANPHQDVIDAYGRLNAVSQLLYGKDYKVLTRAEKDAQRKWIRSKEGEYGNDNSKRKQSYNADEQLYAQRRAQYLKENKIWNSRNAITEESLKNLGWSTDQLRNALYAVNNKMNDAAYKKELEGLGDEDLIFRLNQWANNRKQKKYFTDLQSVLSNAYPNRGAIPEGLISNIDRDKISYDGAGNYVKDSFTYGGKGHAYDPSNHPGDTYGPSEWFENGEIRIKDYYDEPVNGSRDLVFTGKNKAEAMEKLERSNEYLNGRWEAARDLRAAELKAQQEGRAFDFDKDLADSKIWQGIKSTLKEDYIKNNGNRLKFQYLFPYITDEDLASQEAFNKAWNDKYAKIHVADQGTPNRKGSSFGEGLAGPLHFFIKQSAAATPGKARAYYIMTPEGKQQLVQIAPGKEDEVKKYYDFGDWESPIVNEDKTELTLRRLTPKDGIDFNFGDLGQLNDSMRLWDDIYDPDKASAESNTPPFPKMPTWMYAPAQVWGAYAIADAMGKDNRDYPEVDSAIARQTDADWLQVGAQLIPTPTRPAYQLPFDYTVAAGFQGVKRGLQDKGLNPGAANAAVTNAWANTIPALAKADQQRMENNTKNWATYQQLVNDVGKANQEATLKAGLGNQDAYAKAQNVRAASTTDLLKLKYDLEARNGENLGKTISNTLALNNSMAQQDYQNRVLGWGMETGAYAPGPRMEGSNLTDQQKELLNWAKQPGYRVAYGGPVKRRFKGFI